MITKVISGGQTGIDRLGLEVAKSLGIETGGNAPPGFYTEAGCDESLKNFGLIETMTCYRSSNFYQFRTFLNVYDSDGTVYFKSDHDSAGYICTRNAAKHYKRPFIVNPDASEFTKWIDDNNIKILNVAGNRESLLPFSLKQYAEKVLIRGLMDKTRQLKLEF